MKTFLTAARNMAVAYLVLVALAQAARLLPYAWAAGSLGPHVAASTVLTVGLLVMILVSLNRLENR